MLAILSTLYPFEGGSVMCQTVSKDTCLINDVISFSRNRLCALELGLRLRLEFSEIRLNAFSIKRPFEESVVDPCQICT